MKKCAILFKSKYGTTRQYAQWIAEETGGDLYELPKVQLSDLEKYDTIIVGGGLYAGGMLGFSFFKKNFQNLRNKKLIVFSVGASFNSKTNTDVIKAANLTPEMLETVAYFHLRGGLDYPAMKNIDHFAMWCMKKMLERKSQAERDEETVGIIGTYGKKVSFLDRKSLEPLLEVVGK